MTCEFFGADDLFDDISTLIMMMIIVMMMMMMMVMISLLKLRLRSDGGFAVSSKFFSAQHTSKGTRSPLI